MTKIATDKTPAPYASPAHVMGIVRRYRDRDLPEQFTAKMLEELLGIPSGMVHRTLRALQYLGLLSEENTPTDIWQRLRITTDDEFPTELRGIVTRAYADVFKAVDPAKDTPQMIENAFRPYSPAAQRGRMVTCFLSLCLEAGIQPVEAPRRRGMKSPIAGAGVIAPRAALRSGPVAVRASGPAGNEPVASVVMSTSHPLIAGLLRTLPSEIGQPWPKPAKLQWLKTAEAVVDLLYPTTDENG